MKCRISQYFVVLAFLGLLTVAPVVSTHADDLEIFGGTSGGVEPNVLIIFDNSDSMADCVDGGQDGVANANCSISSESRIYKAKEVVKNIINTTDGVRFGLMIFNSNREGGYLVQPCGATKSDLVASVDGIDVEWGSPYIYTPLAETLAEAGLYFAGEQSWFNDGVTYTSPIQWSCQKNNIIIMTDGDPTDDLTHIGDRLYINNDTIGDNDGDSCDPNGCNADGTYSNSNLYDSDGSDYLDDVAYYLFHNDCNADYDDEQLIQTFPIGFAIDNQILADTATNGNYGGKYYTASNATALTSAFEDILTSVQSESDAIYASPVIPRNPENQAQSGNKVYMAFFKPQSDGRWLGNLKSYSLLDGELRDANNLRAVYPQDPSAIDYVVGREGYIKDTARSYWSSSVDGLDVAKGGAGVLLDNNNAREVYTFTYVDSTNYLVLNNPKMKLTDPLNDFRETTNPKITAALLDVADATERGEVLSNTLAGTTFEDENGTTQSWTMGDIIHSEPLVEAYKQNDNTYKNYIFVGANDGMLHVIDAADGQEKWAFIPPKQLPRLKLLLPENNPQKLHHYFVDGSPVIEELNNEKILIFGEGRGGERYYVLKVTDPLDPEWVYQIAEQMLELDAFGDVDFISGAAVLGQSWAKPQLKKIRDVDVDNNVHLYDVFLLAGGYDTRYENPTFSVPSPNNIAGRSIYTVNASSGLLVGPNINGGNWRDDSDQSVMNHSILEVTGFDTLGKGYMNRIYAGDLGGNLFATRYDDARDAWEELHLLDLPEDTITFTDSTNQSVSKNRGQKFMTKPDATLEPGGECIYLGTGDRENLTDTDRVDAFYAVCNDWVKLKDIDGNDILDAQGDYTYTPVPISDLVDVTGNLVQDSADATEKATIDAALKNSSGWYLHMEHPGEKITSSAKVIDGKIFFTTFTPGFGTVNNNDPCVTSFDLGVSRLYAIDYRTGGAVMELDGTGGLSKDDRSTIIGTSVAYEPVLTTSGVKTTLFYGSGGKLLSLDVDLQTLVKRYFWRQLE